MDRPLDIAFHNIQSSEALEAAIREHVERLTVRYPYLTGCRVSIEGIHNQHRVGLPDIHIVFSIPGRDIAVSKASQHARDRHAHTDIYGAVREAFRAAERQLDACKKQPGQDTTAPNGSALTGQVAQIIPGEDHAFILNNVGTQIYFHRDSLTRGDFESLKVGDRVHYVEEAGNAGPTATKVWAA